MITFIAHCPVKPEHAEAFEAAMTEMAAAVHEHEPGAVYYEFSRSVDDPNLFLVIEVYADEAAFKAHWKTDYIRPSLARTQPLMDGPPRVRQYVSPGTQPAAPPERG
jgi:quinol monooxygenase YgiN